MACFVARALDSNRGHPPADARKAVAPTPERLLRSRSPAGCVPAEPWSAMTATHPNPRPPSPWPGSRHETRHRWQLDDVGTLAEAASRLRALASELDAAHAAGWWLVEPVRGGHLLAERASRRRRATQPAPQVATDAPSDAAPVLPPWRLRLVDEPPQNGEPILRLADVPGTPVLSWQDGALRHVAGPPLEPQRRAAVARQIDARDLGHRRWALAPARVGPTADLVADGSALRLHAVADGRLFRTVEAFSFMHTADRAATLSQAAAAYRRLADATDASVAAGGRLFGTDDGLLHVTYPCP